MAIDGVSGVSGVSDVGLIEAPQFEPEALPAAEPAGFSTTDDFTPAEEAAPVDLTGGAEMFVNQLVHDDGQGTGLTGLDPRGLLPAFEQATGLVAGPPEDRHALPPAQQIQFLAQTIASTGNNMEAAAIWHAGPRGTNTQAGREYVDIIKGWISGTDPRFGPFVANLFK